METPTAVGKYLCTDNKADIVLGAFSKKVRTPSAFSQTGSLLWY